MNEMDENFYLGNVSPSGIKKREKKQETAIVKKFFQPALKAPREFACRSSVGRLPILRN